MPNTDIQRLRAIRDDANALNKTLRDDLEPFLHALDKVTFRRLPRSASASGDVNVTTTCTALMALAVNGEIDRFYGIKAKPQQIEGVRRKRLLGIFRRLCRAEWKSSGLQPDNPFTMCIVLRTAGFLAGNYQPDDFRTIEKKSRKMTLAEIAENLAQNVPTSLKIDLSLRENPALAYWLVDAVDKLDITLPHASWRELAKWASSEFARQMSIVAIHHDAMMDPVAMTMAACLVQRLRSIANRASFPNGDEVKRELPTELELAKGTELLFDEQEKSGIWDKFFPMFYYRETVGGANYCFTFEFLEAILKEFGRTAVGNEKILYGLERALEWCHRNRLEYYDGGTRYRGWNSGQQVDSLTVGAPESWATAVVHMFLHQLTDVLSDQIQRNLLVQYKARYPRADAPAKSLWDNYMDSEVKLRDEPARSVKQLIGEHIVTPVKAQEPNASAHLPLEDRPRHQVTLKERRSALLFGPPGTSKTSIVHAVAEQLEWPYIEITPSAFLQQGLERIYAQANIIFDDLMDLSGAVVLFDEMDALVQRRSGADGGERIDVTRQFLTTSMLPKLAELHKKGQVVFFMATNHQREFDEAIKRPGRFDLLICMGPAPWKEKAKKLTEWMSEKEDQPEQIAKVINAWVSADAALSEMLGRFTFGEMRELFDHLARRAGSLRAFVMGDGLEAFKRTIQQWCDNAITLRNVGRGERNRLLEEFEEDKKSSRVQ